MLDHFEAPALHDPDTGNSGFQLALYDLKEEKQTIREFEWKGNRYTETKSAEWVLKRNPARPTTELHNTAEFLSELRSVGTGFRHPRCLPPRRPLELRDLFVYPDLQERDIDKVVGGKPTSVVGEQIAEYIVQCRHALIYGADDSGKTSLSKILYSDFRDRGLIPLMLRPEQLRGRHSDSSVLELLKSAATSQYGPGAAELFMQHEPAKCVLIIDDFHLAKLTKVNQKLLIERFRRKFHFVLVFASELSRVQELTRGSADDAFRDFAHLQMKEFGKFHRHRLIEKWHYLGREDSAEPDELAKLVLSTDKTIATLLGKNVLPHYPVTIITLLQLLEAGEAANTANGSYGYLYEVLIKTAPLRDQAELRMSICN
jgi:hypothetical protein